MEIKLPCGVEVRGYNDGDGVLHKIVIERSFSSKTMTLSVDDVRQLAQALTTILNKNRRNNTTTMMDEHWLLYTIDREHGGCVIMGVFDSQENAYEHYKKTIDEHERYWRILCIEQWKNEQKIASA